MAENKKRGQPFAHSERDLRKWIAEDKQQLRVEKVLLGEAHQSENFTG